MRSDVVKVGDGDDVRVEKAKAKLKVCGASLAHRRQSNANHGQGSIHTQSLTMGIW